MMTRAQQQALRRIAAELGALAGWIDELDGEAGQASAAELVRNLRRELDELAQADEPKG